MVDTTGLSPRVAEAARILGDGGATTAELAESMDPPISESRARAYRSECDTNEQLPCVEQGPDGKYYFVLPDGDDKLSIRQHIETQRSEPQEVSVPLSPPEQSSRTKEAKSVVRDMQLWLNTALSNTEPRPLPTEIDDREDAEDLILLAGDDHLGQKATVPDGSGGTITAYNTEMGLAASEYRVDQVPRYINKFSVDCGTVHYALNGDTVTGTDIYNKQEWDVEKGLFQQVFIGADHHADQITRLANFDGVDNVAVHFQHGNHGRISDGEKAFNADRVCYAVIDRILRERKLDNVYVGPNDEAAFTNFMARGHKFHMRHGQKYLNHAGTSNGENRVRGDIIHHGEREATNPTPVSVVLRNHYHTFKKEEVSGVPIVMGPSLAAPDDFEDYISAFSESAGLLMGVSDDEPISWYKELTVAGGLPIADPRARLGGANA